MRAFNKLDPSSLKAFYFAAQELNFTKAAELAALTQSGISQHIRKLEEELGLSLFQRNNKQVSLTPAGQELAKFIEGYLDSVESLFDNLHQQGTSLRGKVRYAMPDSCLYTPHLGILLEKKAKEFPDVDLHVRICESEEVVSLLLKGEIDFGFVTKPITDRQLAFKEFAREEYVLAGNQKKNQIPQTVQELKELTFINYPGMDELFDQWFASEFPKAKPVRLKDLKIAGEINSLRGAIKMAEGGLGLGVFQKHCVSDQLEEKTLFAYASKASKTENPIFLITHQNVKRPARVEATIETFWEMKKG